MTNEAAQKFWRELIVKMRSFLKRAVGRASYGHLYTSHKMRRQAAWSMRVCGGFFGATFCKQKNASNSEAINEGAQDKCLSGECEPQVCRHECLLLVKLLKPFVGWWLSSSYTLRNDIYLMCWQWIVSVSFARRKGRCDSRV